ncbi:MAG: nucleotidyltransferase family protein [Planctomycetota bacterium]|nr:nucleotidyltransferase family protein [Planctomycetota bacterium]
MVEPFEERMQRGGDAAIAQVERFFMRDDPVHRALHKIASRLEDLNIPHAVCGGMALVAHGYDRTTADVDILVTQESLTQVHQNLVGLGYLPPFEKSKNLRDTELGVRIEFLVAGQFPGDGKPKPVAFPDPSTCAVRLGGISYLSLPALIELKLASGMSNLNRLKDLADVVELIRVLKLKRNFTLGLHPYVRPKFSELWGAVQAAPDSEER